MTDASITIEFPREGREPWQWTDGRWLDRFTGWTPEQIGYRSFVPLEVEWSVDGERWSREPLVNLSRDLLWRIRERS